MGLGFRFSGLDLGFGAKGFGIWLRVLGLVLWDLALGFGLGLGFGVYGFGIWLRVRVRARVRVRVRAS